MTRLNFVLRIAGLVVAMSVSVYGYIIPAEDVIWREGVGLQDAVETLQRKVTASHQSNHSKCLIASFAS